MTANGTYTLEELVKGALYCWSKKEAIDWFCYKRLNSSNARGSGNKARARMALLRQIRADEAWLDAKMQSIAYNL